MTCWKKIIEGDIDDPIAPDIDANIFAWRHLFAG